MLPISGGTKRDEEALKDMNFGKAAVQGGDQGIVITLVGQTTADSTQANSGDTMVLGD